VIAIAAAVTAASAETAATRGRITFEDLASIEQLGAPVLSPAGTEFALVRSGQLALLPADGGWPVPLTMTPGAKSSPAWRKQIAFLNKYLQPEYGRSINSTEGMILKR
jgi:hypothetical protein